MAEERGCVRLLKRQEHPTIIIYKENRNTLDLASMSNEIMLYPQCRKEVNYSLCTLSPYVEA